MSDYRLVVAFDRESEDYARGAEIGMLFERLRRETPPVSTVIHASNAEMALRLAESLGLSVQSEELGDDWLEVVYS